MVKREIAYSGRIYKQTYEIEEVLVLDIHSKQNADESKELRKTGYGDHTCQIQQILISAQLLQRD